MLFPSWIIESDAWRTDVIFLLDDELRFVDFNPAWEDFAAANGGRNLCCSEMRGRLVLDFVPETLQSFYAHKYWLAKRTAGWSYFAYDCSTPEKIRVFRMAMMRVEENLLITNHLQVEEDCEVKPPLTAEETASYLSPTGLTTMCANCRKTKHAHKATQWDWIPEMLRRNPFTISHGLCPRCMVYLYG